jgi:non-ribosomal peptide synthetase component F
LGRCAGTDDVVLGTPVSGRNRAETEDLVGFFVNTVVLRTDLSGDPVFTEVLDRVRDAALSAFVHQDVPFEQVVEAVVTDRDRSRTPVFQVLFTYGTAAGPGPVRSMPVQFDLVVGLAETGNGMTAEFHWSTALFDESTIERMAGGLTALLAAVALNAGTPIADLPILTGADERRLERWNRTARALPAFTGITGQIAQQAAGRPDAVAVVHGSQHLTARALEERAGRLAAHLTGLGEAQAGAFGDDDVAWCRSRSTVAVARVWAWSGSACPEAWTWWSPFWRSGGPAAPICRWTRTIHLRGWSSCWPTAGCGWSSARGRWPGR